MERRFKLGLVSLHYVTNGGKDFAKILQNSIPEGTDILLRKENLSIGSTELLLYNKQWDPVPDGEELEKVIIVAARPVIERI